MATLPVTPISRAGLDVAGVAADAALSDEFPNTGFEFIEIKNGGGGTITVTLDIKPTVDGAAIVDPTLTIAAGVTKIIGPFPPALYNDSTTQRAKVSYSGVTTVTIKVFKIAPGT
jgi:hypothetical protein